MSVHTVLMNGANSNLCSSRTKDAKVGPMSSGLVTVSFIGITSLRILLFERLKYLFQSFCAKTPKSVGRLDSDPNSSSSTSIGSEQTIRSKTCCLQELDDLLYANKYALDINVDKQTMPLSSTRICIDRITKSNERPVHQGDQ